MRIRIDGLGFLAAGDSAFEFAQALSEHATRLWQAFGPENQKHDEQEDRDMSGGEQSGEHAAILGKLDARTRGEAAAQAGRLGMTPKIDTREPQYGGSSRCGRARRLLGSWRSYQSN